jgi:hypothetical protein
MKWCGNRGLMLALVVTTTGPVAVAGALAETIPGASELVEPGPAGAGVGVEDPGTFGLKNAMSRAGNLILFRRPGRAFARVELAPPRRPTAGPAMMVGADTEAEAKSGSGAADLPTVYALRRNAPNPSQGTAMIGFDLPTTSRVRLEVHDLQGRRVQILVDGELPAGRHSRTWSAREGDGHGLPPGVYFVSIDARATSGAGRFTKVSKTVLIE